MDDNEPAADDAPPPQIDQKAFREAQFSPRKKGTAQMTNQAEGDK